MTIILDLCRLCAVLVAAFGFLLGQAFSGQFELAATQAGVFGLVAATLGLTKSRLTRTTAWVVFAASGLALVGVGLDVHDYYVSEHSSGNYYAWFLAGPYCAALIVIGAHATSRITRSGPSADGAPMDD